jgi:FkbM family methyltransferase
MIKDILIVLKRKYDERVTTYKQMAFKRSYSQCGEDLIIDFIFTNYLNILKPMYLDIGAHHPTYLSNTYHFYKKGSTGVCVEPDKTLCREIHNKRRRDVCLNAGVGFTRVSHAPFYIMSEKTLSTFSREDAERYEKCGHYSIKEVTKVNLLPINTIISQYCKASPNLVSLDVEGVDYEIVNSMDLDKYRPEVFCIETLTFAQDKSEKKVMDIITFMHEKDYFVYADTYINTIFVDNEAWRNRQ